MSTPLKFEFDFDEVFEGIKQGVIRELAETNFESAKDTAINQIKSEIKEKIRLTYRDELELKDEIKREIKERVFDSLIKEVNGKYLDQFNEYIGKQLTKNPDRLRDLTDGIKTELSEQLYDDLYHSIRNEITEKVKNTTSQLCDLIGGNSVRIQGSEKIISKEEYEELVGRDKTLTALEAGGVDNWEWYDESLRQYYENEE